MPNGLPIPGMMGASHPLLQATLQGASSTNSPSPLPHHPIMCTDKLYYEEDGTFRCEHTVVGPDDIRTQQCVIHSVALLIIELGLQL